MSTDDPDFAARQQRIQEALPDALAILRGAAAGPPSKAQRRAQRALDRHMRATQDDARRDRR